ncbi:HAMP domain-containing histidine kinase [Paenibacillus sp. MER TA 81-3]|uniref:HAMP domain-containing sensor histidine kinase n=1 Tax=Paenibacillus sp. MER TA 81-3 TaxID=2939573 RepID=UPI00203DEE6B|nr:HAMP domain-containing sensor histidine kinase [Paenibacillus sp. MER TA 81-3]MCM3339211.1 HAMP domain-containing histidine kinase [Paenibacillus sp. MER TA 81-3]
MKAKGMLLTMLVVFIAGIILSVQVIGAEVNTDVDIVMANRVLKTVESHWEQIEQGDYSGITQQFIVLDQSGNVRYQTADGLSMTINDAIRNRDSILDVMVEGTPAGKLIIHDDYDQKMQRNKEQLVTVILITFTVLTVLCVLYIIFLNHAVITPFKKLQSFALNVARGNLDIPLNMDKNNPFGAFTESFDMMREELAAARQSEYEANRSKKELVASLSHDVKTPVASIKAVSELMLLRANDEKAIKQLNMIYSKAEQINLLVTDMFHATLEELKELKVNVTEEYSGVLKGIIANVNYDDQITCDPIPDCIILTDVTRLQQVFDNILSNSYKYAGTAVKISSFITPTHLQIEIMDYGNGVSRDELPLLFNKFYRGNNIAGQTGAGLGLFISNYLMQSMQGDIECHNRDDGFTVTLRIKLV